MLAILLYLFMLFCGYCANFIQVKTITNIYFITKVFLYVPIKQKRKLEKNRTTSRNTSLETKNINSS